MRCLQSRTFRTSLAATRMSQGGGDIFRDVERMNAILRRPAHVQKVDILFDKRSLPEGNGCSESSRLRPVGLVFLSLVGEVMSTAFSAMKILASCRSNCLLISTCGQSQDCRSTGARGATNAHRWCG